MQNLTLEDKLLEFKNKDTRKPILDKVRHFSVLLKMMDRVIFTKVDNQLKKLPRFIVLKLLAWAKSVELKGLREVRKIPGYHDEPLKGHRQGQRSIRLSKGYRAIYVEELDGSINLVILERVSKHEH